MDDKFPSKVSVFWSTSNAASGGFSAIFVLASVNNYVVSNTDRRTFKIIE